jgi:hypothetical protein
LTDERRQAARRIIENAYSYYTDRARSKHLGVEIEWIVRVLTDPLHTEVEPSGRIRYWGYIPEWEDGRWLRVIVENERLLNAFPDRNKKSLWGVP